MIMCDTNVLVEFLKARQPVLGQLQKISLANLSISEVVRAELIFGALDKSDLSFILKGIAPLRQFSLHAAISVVAINLMQQFSLSHRLGFPDALIAATALHHGLPLFTLNRKDFRYIPGLQLHEPA